MYRREFLITVEDVNNDGSEYKLVCYLNNKLIRSKMTYDLSDCIYALGDFQRDIYDDYVVDCRSDKFEVKVDIII